MIHSLRLSTYPGYIYIQALLTVRNAFYIISSDTAYKRSGPFTAQVKGMKNLAKYLSLNMIWGALGTVQLLKK